MKFTHWLGIAGLVLGVTFVGCKDGTPDKPKTPGKSAESSADDKLNANLAKLDDADRKIAEAQKFCAIENESRLGSMGKPIKIMVKDQAVFLCCKSCEKRAKADPDKTLAKAEELKKH